MTSCPREWEIVQAITAGAGQGVLCAELQDHLRECTDCREAAAVSSAMLEDRDAAWHTAAPPSADVVWLRAQLTARAEAARLAARPVFLVQALGAACVVGAIAGVVGTAVWWLRSWATWLTSVGEMLTNAPGTMDMAALATRGILLALAVWLVIAPVAVYLAATED